MTAGREDPNRTQSQTTEPPQEEYLWEECMEDITLPPGGKVRRILERSGVVPSGHMATPDYLTKSGRDLRIDLLRGYFVVAMIVDHVRGPSPLYLVTGGNRFFTSAAEGFFLTSGLVTGLVYRRLIERDNLGSALLKILTRAMSLYLLTIGLTLLFLPISEILYLPWAQGVDMSDPLRLVVSILTLHRTYYLVDVMLLYSVLFLIAPLAFVILATGHTWPVLAASWVLWGLYQVYPEYAALPWPIAGNYLFQFSAWQVLFFSGLVLGYRQDRIPALSKWATRVGLILTGLGTLALIVTFYIVDPPTAVMPETLAAGSPVFHEIRLWLQDNIFAKVDLRIGRLVASAITFNFLFMLITHFWGPVRRFVGRLLLPLGQHALYGYTAHIIVVGMVALILKPFSLPYPGPQLLNAVIQILSVWLIWLLVKHQFLAPTAKTQRAWYSLPAALALAVIVFLLWHPSPTHPGLSPEPVAAASDRVPRRFGTPLTKRDVAVATNPVSTPVASATTPVATTPVPTTPTPTPEPRPSDSGSAEARLAPYAQGLMGTLEEHWFYSPELDRDMPYVVYLPPDYATARRRYPVLYMLHGRGGHRDEWLAYDLMAIADREIRTGRLLPMLIVLPQGDKGYWANHTNDGPRWGEYLLRDVVSHIDATYRTLRSPTARAIGGLSMGGWGALHHAFNRPDVFGVVGAHSPSLRPDESTIEFLGSGDELAGKDPIVLAQTKHDLNGLRIWIDTAQDDPWLDRTTLLHEILSERGIEHIWQIYPGVHDWTYWHEHAVDYLHFYGNSLARQ